MNQSKAFCHIILIDNKEGLITGFESDALSIEDQNKLQEIQLRPKYDRFYDQNSYKLTY